MGVVVGLTLAVMACQPPEEQRLESTEGEAQVVVRGLSAYNIDRMVITAQPANVTQTLVYNADMGSFSGRLVLPAGEHTLVAEGYSSSYYGGDGGFSDGGFVDAGMSSDGGSTSGGTRVATGSALVTIVAGTTTAVTLRVYDITPPPPQGDIGPIIRSVTSSRSETTVGSSIVLSVDAVDLDGDALSYSWSSSCPTSAFSSPFSASTSWSNSSSGVCRISVTVSSRSLSATESLEVAVFSAPVDGGPGEGSVQVNGEYIARPNVTGMYFSGPGGGTSVYRYNQNAMLPNAQPGMSYYVDLQVDYGTRFGTFVNSMEDNCGGTWTRSWDSCSSGGYCSAQYNWTAPSVPTVCKLTARAANGTLTDSFSVGIAVR